MTLKHRIGKVILPLLPVDRRTFDILRFEANAYSTRMLNLLSPLRRMRMARMRRRDNLNVNLGSGGRGLPDWINVDVVRTHKDQSIAHDIRRGLPFRTGQVRRVFAEHVVEHLNFRSDVPRLFRDVYRVLTPSGRFRIIVPDAQRWLEAYVTGDPAKWAALGMRNLPADMPTPMAMINHVFHQGGEHLFAYDYDTLRYALMTAGFTNIWKSSFRVSDDPELAIDRDEHEKYSLYVEAQK